ncbi:Various environmental stresses-induced protein Ves [[Clostridium] aminophilum]|uniref:Various environmental stresses-induced protein Ves n=1 Tax=[Clostridium] aminophilum TaxID=1526 RepID=A0A1I0I0M4_9FIRM|nr:HutD family protein [[Clostridium] aminophilum]SET89243.1 Various environmental stresses-induced protein Ves [[Clostridium] aminophilum]
MAFYISQVVHRDDYKTTDWSGGKTTEIGIAPKGSEYADRDFLWRLSSATVDVEESEFTSLPDYNRIIMTLKGDISLSHNGERMIDLPEFTPHRFDGGDKTVSVGKVTDFNLMLRKDICEGTVVPLRMQTGETVDIYSMLITDVPSPDEVMVYCYRGCLVVKDDDGKQFRIESGDTLRLSGNFRETSWQAKAEEGTLAVAACVHYIPRTAEEAEKQVKSDMEALKKKLEQ